MAVPPQLKAVQHHYKTALEHDERDPVVAYYCRLYAMQTGMKLDSKTPECRMFLMKLMDQLELMKKELSTNESISQEIVGNAHIENYALKLFYYADNEDRSGRFHKNMIKSFYTSSLLLDVLCVFGELSEENLQHRKYARWKSTYIHNCLKNGEIPQSGPIGLEGEAYDEFGIEAGGPSYTSPGPSQPQPSSSVNLDQDQGPASIPPANFNTIQVPPGSHAPANTPADLPHPAASAKPVPAPRIVPVGEPLPLTINQPGDVHLSAEDFTRAQKYCKYAGSALQYEDISTAVHNLQKALKLLTTGEE